ncbi:hypothetical protein HRbin40_00681 [bacterium HR40]|nr:hypothetical protein HRbin40_00681 [bacterium HR40]
MAELREPIRQGVAPVDVREAMRRASALRAAWLATQLKRLVQALRRRLHIAPAPRPARTA